MSQSAYVAKVAGQIAARHQAIAEAIGTAGIETVVAEAFEAAGIVHRLAERISVGGKRLGERFDPYAGYSAAEREFAEDMDLWTLEQVIVRVMTEIDRRRKKHLGGMKAMAKRQGAAP
jgi:hypothetical protein